MHTLDKRLVTLDDFEVGTSQYIIEGFNTELRIHKANKDVTKLKMNLPEGWLQERQVCINYMTLQNILSQREGHRLKMWQIFREQILAQVEHPELIAKQTGEPK
jgi:hypothetical protein